MFLLHTHKGQYSISEMSQLLDLRQATCWSFGQKTIDAILRRQAAEDYDEQEDWTHVLLVIADESEAGIVFHSTPIASIAKKEGNG